MDGIFNDIVDDLITEATKNLRVNNKHYAELKQGTATISVILDTMFKSRLAKAELEELDKYNEMLYESIRIEQKHLYLSGIKDCYRLLKLITL